jgi:hypothetical protein
MFEDTTRGAQIIKFRIAVSVNNGRHGKAFG